MTAIQSDAHADARKFDKALAGRFDSAPSAVELRREFLSRYGLGQPNRRRVVDGIDEMSLRGGVPVGRGHEPQRAMVAAHP